MKQYQRNAQIPKNSGGSYETPKEIPEQGLEPKRFVMKEKTGEMLRYAMPLVNSFPRRDRKLADSLRESMLELYRLITRLERKYYKKTTLEEADIELAVLREFIVLASDKKCSGPKYPPPVTMHQREVWSRYTMEIGKMIGGYKKAIESKSNG